MMDGLPGWIQTIRRKYTGGEASLFLLHGNVFDVFRRQDRFLPLTEFLVEVLLKPTKTEIAVMDPSRGLRFLKRSDAEQALPVGETGPETWRALEQRFYHHDGNALIVQYAGHYFPNAPVHFLSPADRAALVTIHRWSLSRELARRDNVVFLLVESLSELNPQLVANPGLAAVEVPMPDENERAAVIGACNPTFDAAQRTRLARHSAGLRALQLAAIFKPKPVSTPEDDERHRFIRALLGDQPEAESRAAKLAALTAGMSLEEIRHLVDPDAPLPDSGRGDPLAEMLELLRGRKRELIERQCAGLIEFVESPHGLEAVGGMEAIKRELMGIAAAIRRGDTARTPMGLLFVGAMGTGKTFIAKAFARSSGLTAIALKNFRDRWVGSTEANLERVLSLVKALGPIILIIDEGDRAFGAESGEGDGGTSSRVMARLKAFMSDPANRGRVLFILMTNRPDKLDADLKRAGRLDRKIPFFYPGDTESVMQILTAILKRHHIEFTWTQNDPGYRDILAALIDYSIADIEAVALLAHELADGKPLTCEHLRQAVNDYLPSRDTEMIEYMNLLAVFEASRRSLLPERYANLTPEELSRRLAEKCRILGIH